MVILFRFRIIFLFILFYSCQGQNDQAKQSGHKYPNLQIVNQVLKHEISEYKEIIDSTNISSKVLYVFYQQQSDETQIYHIGCYLGAYSFYNSNIQMIYEYENYLITFKIDGISAFRLDSLSRMDIPVMLTPHSGDIDPLLSNGSKNEMD